jgi:chromate transporter
MSLLELFKAFFQIGMFSFGGGMAAIPLVQEGIVAQRGWLTMTQFTDLITIAEMTPGPIAVNSATFVGMQLFGLPGAIVATAGCILPSIILVSLLAVAYSKYKEIFWIKGALNGLRPAVVALIASAGITILFLAVFGTSKVMDGIESINVIGFLLFAAGLFVLRKWKVSPIQTMMLCGLCGGFLYSVI